MPANTAQTAVNEIETPKRLLITRFAYPKVGDLRHRVYLQVSTKVMVNGHDEYGWTNTLRLPADVQQIRGKELFEAERYGHSVTYRVMLRYNSDISTKNQFLFEDRTLRITDVIDLDGKQRWLECLCDEVQ
ncbi:MAG: phage head closure protein [Candidatus Methanoperedens sp.]